MTVHIFQILLTELISDIILHVAKLSARLKLNILILHLTDVSGAAVNVITVKLKG
ncbi:hypothetical protein ACGCUP_01080 [Eubacteriales bacterium KG125]